MRLAKAMAAALVAALLVWSEPVAADIDLRRADGWHSWQVDEPAPASAMCCFSWRRGSPSQTGCDLDGGNNAFTSDGDCAAEPGRVRFYALIEDGSVSRVLALSSACPVTAAAAIEDHGIVSAADNLAWFRSVIEDRRIAQSVREIALFGLAQSQSDTAFEYIDSLLSRR